MGSRRATDCIAGDKPVDADSPAPGRRVRDLPTAGVPAAGASFLTGAGNRRLSPCPGKQELSAGTHPERTACVRGSNADTNTVRELPGAAARLAHRRCARRRRGGVQGFLPLKSLFICRSGRDGDSLACPLPWLCFRPAGLVTCCFFTDLCAHCLFACSALFARVFSLVFLLFFCPFLPNFFLSNFFSFVAQAATGLYFRPISPFPALLAGLSGHSAANRRQIRETLEKPRSKAPAFQAFLCVRRTPAPFRRSPPFSGCWPA